MKKLLLFFLLFILNCSLVHAQNWVWGAQGSNSADIWNVATDDKGNAFQTGYFSDSTSFGTYVLKSGVNDAVFLVKYNSKGTVQWAKQSGSPNSSVAFSYSVTTDTLGNAYITGMFMGTIWFGNDTLYDKVYTYNVFLVKYDANGNVLWAKQSKAVSKLGNGYGNFVAVDSSGNPYITGYFSDTITFGNDTLRAEKWNVFLVKYNINGKLMWAKQSKAPGAISGGMGTSVAIDASGNAFVTGYFIDTICFGTDTLNSNTSPLYYNVFLTKYDSSGKVLWARQASILNNTNYALSYSVATDVSGNSYITGYFYSGISFGSYNLSSSGASVFFAKYGPNGSLCWAKQSYGKVYAEGYGLASDKYGHLFFSGSMKGNISFCNDTLYEPTGSVDPAMVMELDTSGNALCASITKTGGDDQNAIACDKSGRYVYFGGDIADTITFGKNFLTPGSGFASEPPFVARWHPCSDVVDTVQQPEASGPCGDIFIPDAFSPNGDGQNDVLYVRCNCLSIMDFIVFDRWGNKVFESNDINVGWDGTYKGKNENTGTYVYYLKGMYTDGSSFSKKGNVALVR